VAVLPRLCRFCLILLVFSGTTWRMTFEGLIREDGGDRRGKWAWYWRWGYKSPVGTMKMDEPMIECSALATVVAPYWGAKYERLPLNWEFM
jgi:hypothetical protein